MTSLYPPGANSRYLDISCFLFFPTTLLNLDQNGKPRCVVNLMFCVYLLLILIVADIPTVIRRLTQSPPSLQETVLKQYFTNNASFVHPFCRVPNFEGSRWWVSKIFQWYKIMSPRIELEIHSIGMSIREVPRSRTA